MKMMIFMACLTAIITVLQLHCMLVMSSSDHYAAFTDTSLTVCLSATENQDTFGVDVGRNTNPSIKSSFEFYNLCIYQQWKSCRRLQMAPAGVKEHNITNRPCWLGSLHLADHNYSVHIRVAQRFQLNLTFLHFNLKRYGSECKYHYVQVK